MSGFQWKTLLLAHSLSFSSFFAEGLTAEVICLWDSTVEVHPLYLKQVAFLGGLPTSSKAGKFEFGETDPRNIPRHRPSNQTTKQTLEFCRWEVWKLPETHPETYHETDPKSKPPVPGKTRPYSHPIPYCLFQRKGLTCQNISISLM